MSILLDSPKQVLIQKRGAAGMKNDQLHAASYVDWGKLYWLLKQEKCHSYEDQVVFTIKPGWQPGEVLVEVSEPEPDRAGAGGVIRS